MKKLFLIVFTAIALAACNNTGESTDNKKDSLDSIANAQKAAIDSSADRKIDVIDSVTQRKKDSLDRIDSINRATGKDTTNK